MNRQAIIQTLRARQDELRQRGVAFLALLDSSICDQADQTSEVDLLAEFDRTLSEPLRDIFDLKFWLKELLGGVRADLVQKTAVHPALKERILAEAIHVAWGLALPHPGHGRGRGQDSKIRGGHVPRAIPGRFSHR